MKPKAAAGSFFAAVLRALRAALAFLGDAVLDAVASDKRSA